MNSVLVLNASYEPLHIVSVHRALVLLLKDKAEVLEATEERIRSANLTMPIPSVIRLVYYVRVPRRIEMPLTRRTLLLRDNYTCQYCGAHGTYSNLTMDHVVPRVRGGATSWENVVCACKPCNSRKGSKTLHEANMRLLRDPGRPHFIALVVLSREPMQAAWSKYLPDVPVIEIEHPS